MQRLLLPALIALLLPAAWSQDAKKAATQQAEANDSAPRATEAQRDQKWDATIEALTQAIRANPDDPAAYVQRGEVYRSIGRFDEAIADFNEAIRRRPEFTSAYYHRASLYLLILKPALALADAEEEIRQKPNDRLGYLLRARAKTQLGDEAGAAEDKAKAAELKANEPGPDAIWPAQVAQAPGAQRIGGNVMAANIVHKVAPEYPDFARQARIKGTVRFSVMIGKDGSVESIQLISGHPLLAEAARTAVQQWQYKPTLLNGQPVRVATTVDVNFTLRE